MNFDPYHKWLGIPSDEQPPNHYRLLAISQFESDPDVIDAAAQRQMAFVQQCAAGPHTESSQRLLNELSAARICLLVPDKKASYDRQLREWLAASASPEPAVHPQRSRPPVEFKSIPDGLSLLPWHRSILNHVSQRPVMTLAYSAGMLLLIVFIVVISSPRKEGSVNLGSGAGETSPNEARPPEVPSLQTQAVPEIDGIPGIKSLSGPQTEPELPVLEPDPKAKAELTLTKDPEPEVEQGLPIPEPKAEDDPAVKPVPERARKPLPKGKVTATGNPIAGARQLKEASYVGTVVLQGMWQIGAQTQIRNAKGKIRLTFTKIHKREVDAKIEAFDGLIGTGELKGRIDDKGRLNLTGILDAGIDGAGIKWAINLRGTVKGEKIENGRYELTYDGVGVKSRQEAQFSALLEDD